MRSPKWIGILLLIGLGMQAPRAAAFEPDASTPSSTVKAETENRGGSRAFDRYVVGGGWVTLYTLIPLSVVALALSLQFGLAIRRKTIVPPEVVQRLSELIGEGDYPGVLKFTSEDSSVIGAVVNSGLMEAKNGYAAMERAMVDSIEENAAKLTRKIEYLNLIGNVAPMLGLFGTVQGIIGMFNSISDSGGIPVMARISADLGSALVATFWGLLVAIPSLAIFGLLRNRIDVLLTETATNVDRLMAIFKPQTMEPVRPMTATTRTTPQRVASAGTP
ncbi:MAG: MotA/TolQ/ExbB proton channel family protein [Planctomycetota bacterium]